MYVYGKPVNTRKYTIEGYGYERSDWLRLLHEQEYDFPLNHDVTVVRFTKRLSGYN